MSEARQGTDGNGRADGVHDGGDPAADTERVKGLGLAHQVARAVGPVAPFLSMATYAGLAASEALAEGKETSGDKDGDEVTGSR
ncbi:hypothetical protein BAY61_08515 [Prauserella marina]|uniref:Uncharacterized protein n=1 Tax=Prauserella marina TaxID=530584 RepID=A0A222VMB0_9PSEU|nr:hypothetical protein [Prauserella marina]ASR35017.1 hypothetical protein BAY61_08515 [Prauserella marina]PWV85251.1 hypothetical protein DES30_1011277 [Prauserella marina]SDC01363.1 hypothetical protein SAMN05421630_10161 [Prauserella marina]